MMIHDCRVSYYLITRPMKLSLFIMMNRRKASLIKNLEIEEDNSKESYDSSTHPSNVLFLSWNLQRFAGIGSVLLGPWPSAPGSTPLTSISFWRISCSPKIKWGIEQVNELTAKRIMPQAIHLGRWPWPP